MFHEKEKKYKYRVYVICEWALNNLWAHTLLDSNPRTKQNKIDHIEAKLSILMIGLSKTNQMEWMVMTSKQMAGTTHPDHVRFDDPHLFL